MQKFTAFLMFAGEAEEAMTFYTSLFPQSEIKLIRRYSEQDFGPTGAVKHAVFALNGQEFIAIDSSVHHAFTFTPAISIFVECESETEIDRVFNELSKGGQIFMPLEKMPFSEKFAWLNDRFGVSWQLSYHSSIENA